ncbi:MAG: 30S ribosomal protein S18 [Proteobacteria bacterium]|nr:30S ribosomal protein S18 [Pseudomonadota bacterium]
MSNINKVQKPPLDKEVDYKDVDALSVFVSERGRILPRRITGVSAKMQRRIAKAIKRARMLLLMPFTK